MSRTGVPTGADDFVVPETVLSGEVQQSVFVMGCDYGVRSYDSGPISLQREDAGVALPAPERKSQTQSYRSTQEKLPTP